MSEDRYIAFKLLADKCGKVLGYRELYPDDIFWIAYSYINGGCKSRKDYEYLVNFLFENNDWRREYAANSPPKHSLALYRSTAFRYAGLLRKSVCKNSEP